LKRPAAGIEKLPETPADQQLCGDAGICGVPGATRLSQSAHPAWRTTAKQSAGRHLKGETVASVKRLPAISAQQNRQSAPSRQLLSVGEVCAELQIASSTFYEWRTKGTGPRCIKLPNGQIRVRRSDLNSWLDAREDAA
jgi:predicted DNA-binding transcriptional regulator AlpA